MNKNLTAKQELPEITAIDTPVTEIDSVAVSPDKPTVMQKRIGSTTYQVSVHFSKTSTETIGDKISRLIQNEAESGKAVG